MKTSIVIIPVREFQNTKLRLIGTLSADQRAALTCALIRRVLYAAQKSDVAKVFVVASDPVSVSTQTQEFSKVKVIRESMHHGGVNSAMMDGINAINHSQNGYESDLSLILLPSDLPLITSGGLNKILHLLTKYDLLINPSLKLDGTSLLAFNARNGKIPLHYDDNSFYKHDLEAKDLGIKYRILKWKQFSFDVDTEEDLKRLMTIYNSSSLKGLMEKINSCQ